MNRVDCFYENLNQQYQFYGIVDETVDFLEEFQLLDETLWNRFSNQFSTNSDDYDAGWRGEYWGKMMRGACFVYAYTKDETLYATLEHTVLNLMEKADSFGRISTYSVDCEFDGWDLWSRKYVLLGMEYFLEICSDEALKQKIIASMSKQLDYIISKIGDGEGKKPINSCTRFWRGLNSSSILEPVVRLYLLTKEQHYFDFAQYIVDQGGTEVENIFHLAYEDKLYPYQYPMTKAYEMISCFEGLLEFYRATGKEEYKTAVVNFANKVLESDFTIIGCCGCTHEQFDHSTVRQANTTNGIVQETCVTVTVMKFLYQLTRLTGDAKYSDAFETCFYNAYLGAVNTEKVTGSAATDRHEEELNDCVIEPLPFDSYSPLTADVRGIGIGGLKVMADKHFYGCCACIGAAGVGLMPKMTLFQTSDGFAYNMFIPGTVYSETPGGNPIAFHTQTAYPAEGKVLVTLELKKEEAFTVKVRNPYWSEGTTLFVNGEGAAVTEGYTAVTRTWKNGDTLEFTLDMRTKAIYPVNYGHQILMTKVTFEGNYIVPTYDEQDEKAKYHVALKRGPIVLAQENRLGYSVDEPVDIAIEENGIVKTTVPEVKKAPYPTLVEVCVPLKDGKNMHVTDYASAGKLWSEESKMAAWMLTKTAMF